MSLGLTPAEMKGVNRAPAHTVPRVVTSVHAAATDAKAAVELVAATAPDVQVGGGDGGGGAAALHVERPRRDAGDTPAPMMTDACAAMQTEKVSASLTPARAKGVERAPRQAVQSVTGSAQAVGAPENAPPALLAARALEGQVTVASTAREQAARERRATKVLHIFALKSCSLTLRHWGLRSENGGGAADVKVHQSTSHLSVEARAR